MKLSSRDVVIAVISVMLIASYCAAVLYNIFKGRPYQVPDAFLAIVISVVSYFFGQHAATNGAYAAGVTAATAAASTLAQTNAEKKG